MQSRYHRQLEFKRVFKPEGDQLSKCTSFRIIASDTSVLPSGAIAC